MGYANAEYLHKCLEYILLLLVYSLGKKASNVTSSRSIWLDDIQAPTADTFRIDKKPDPANWAYKSLYRGDIARYKTSLLVSHLSESLESVCNVFIQRMRKDNWVAYFKIWLGVGPVSAVNDIPGRSVLGQVLSNVFIDDMDSRIKGTLSKFHNTKLSSAVNAPEGWE